MNDVGDDVFSAGVLQHYTLLYTDKQYDLSFLMEKKKPRNHCQIADAQEEHVLRVNYNILISNRFFTW